MTVKAMDESSGRFRIIVAGGREFDDYELLTYQLDCIVECYWSVDLEIVSGTARGADQLGERWAAEHDKPVKRMPANWDKHQKSAGALRNIEMAQASQVLVAFWDGKSRGTRHMITTALEHGLNVHVFRYNDKDTQTQDMFGG